MARSKLDPTKLEEFFENLRAAAWVFETQKDGRFTGAILACKSVEHLIAVHERGAELAGPFRRISEAFADRERGGNPALFKKKTAAKGPRSRSPEHKKDQTLAAAFLEVLLDLGDSLRPAANKVARAVARWPSMEHQAITGDTIIGWRKKFSKVGDELFNIQVRKTLEERDPRATVDKWLKSGPPGRWRG